MDETTTIGAHDPRSLDAGRGVAWWTGAWALFMKQPGMWLVLAVILLLICVVLAFIPLLGALATSLLLPVFSGGWMLAARKVAAGGALEPGDLFTGFKEKLSPLLVLGALLLAATLVIGVVASVLGIGAFTAGMASGANHSAGGTLAAVGVGLFALLLALAMGAVVGMAMWFAPALVVFRGVEPVAAIKASMAASLKNIVPFLIWGLIYIAASVIASIPFMLGWIVLVPVLLSTAYVSYEDVFGGRGP